MAKQTPETKARKTVEGTIRSKERTKEKLIDAVGLVLTKKGYSGLTINNIIAEAKVDRRLISLYFGDVNNLIEAYLSRRDYWMSQVTPNMKNINEQKGEFGINELKETLHQLYDTMDNSPELQKMILWQISEVHPKLTEIATLRDSLSNGFFQPADKKFKKTGIDLRAIVALQIAGIYFLILHSKTNKAPFCEIQTETEKGKKQIKNAMKTILDLVYEKANK